MDPNGFEGVYQVGSNGGLKLGWCALVQSHEVYCVAPILVNRVQDNHQRDEMCLNAESKGSPVLVQDINVLRTIRPYSYRYDNEAPQHEPNLGRA